MNAKEGYGIWQTTFLTLLRMSIGWHCLHEGVIKLTKPGPGSWTGYGYMANAKGPLAGVFKTLAENSAFIAFSDQAVMWILTICGACLLIGLFTRFSSFMLIGLIAMFYLANPPIYGDAFFGKMLPGAEGTYFIINKNIIEIFALGVIMAFENGQIPGLDVYTRKLFAKESGK